MMQSSAFSELKRSQKELSDLQQVKMDDELQKIKAEHQRVLMEVQEVYARFLFLLKLIVRLRIIYKQLLDISIFTFFFRLRGTLMKLFPPRIYMRTIVRIVSF